MKKISPWLTVISFCFLIFFWSSIPDLKSGFDPAIDVVLRKIVHAAEFGLLFYFIYLALKIKPNGKKIIIAIIFALIYALSDEFHQSFVPGREMALLDFLIDAMGIIFASYLVYLNSKNKKAIM